MPRTGRPTRYLKKYCDRVIELGREGYSKAEIASDLDVHYNTLHLWMEAHPEFMDAMDRSRRESQAWWEKKGRVHLVAAPEDAKINAALYSRSMAARFPDDWREKSEVKNDVVVTTLTDAERAAKLNGILDSARVRRDRQVDRVGQAEVDTSGGTSE